MVSKGIALWLGISGVWGWWDKGHMLVGSIAKLVMKPENVEYIEGIMKEWESFYPGFNTLESAPTWMDHIKCHDDSASHCAGLQELEGIGFLDSFHYNPVHFNPYQLEMPTPSAQASSRSFLISSIETLRKFGIRSMMHQMTLRALLHVMGDIHQPMHSASLVCKWSGAPKEDRGGNFVLLGHPYKNKFPNLHSLFDAMGYHQASYPELGVDQVVSDAEMLLAKHPRPPQSQVVDKSSIVSWVEEAREFSPRVYKELLPSCLNRRNFNHTPYVPSRQYLDFVKDLSEKQVVKAGYRLGAVLDMIADTRREVESSTSYNNNNEVLVD